MSTKTQQAKHLFESGDLKAALKITKDFRLGLHPQERKALSLGYEAIVHPSFYVQLKKDPQTLVESAKEVLHKLLGGKE
jgi:hypothetical protein